MKRAHILLIVLLCWAPYLVGWAGDSIYTSGITLGDWTISESGGNLVFAKSGVVHVTMADSEIRCDVYADDDGNDMVVDNGGDLQLKAPGGTDTDYISMFCEAGGERFRFYQTGAIAGGDIDVKIGFFDDDEGPENIYWNDGWDCFVAADRFKADYFASINGYYGSYDTNPASFPKGIRLQEMTSPGTPSSGNVYVWSNSGSDDDLTATYDNGKNNIFSTKPN